MAYPTHNCFLCKAKHDAAYWCHRTVDGVKVYACGGKYNDLQADEEKQWLHPDS